MPDWECFVGMVMMNQLNQPFCTQLILKGNKLYKLIQAVKTKSRLN